MKKDLSSIDKEFKTSAKKQRKSKIKTEETSRISTLSLPKSISDS